MILYHGSSEKIERLEGKQAQSVNKVPEGELLNAVYLTPDYGFALACGARPEGTTNIDGEKKTIEFEHPELFDPEKEVYMYHIESESVPEGHLHQIDNHQYAVEGLQELMYQQVDHRKARDVMEYYKLINWEPNEATRELRHRPR